MIFSDLSGTQEVINAYNANNSWLSDQFGAFKYLHGFHTGLRFQKKPLAWELNYSKRFNNKRAIGNDPDFGVEATRKINYDVELVSFVQEFQFGDFGVGASIDYNWLDIRTEVIDLENARTVVKDEAWSSQFYLVFHTPKSGFVSLSIQPYVQVSWTNFDVTELGNALNVNVGKNNEDNFSHFGIKLIFYNGE